jgi:hypothetical protein
MGTPLFFTRTMRHQIYECSFLFFVQTEGFSRESNHLLKNQKTQKNTSEDTIQKEKKK